MTFTCPHCMKDYATENNRHNHIIKFHSNLLKKEAKKEVKNEVQNEPQNEVKNEVQVVLPKKEKRQPRQKHIEEEEEQPQENRMINNTTNQIMTMEDLIQMLNGGKMPEPSKCGCREQYNEVIDKLQRENDMIRNMIFKILIRRYLLEKPDIIEL